MPKVTYFKDDPIVIAALAVKISQTPFEQGDMKKLYRQCKWHRKGSRNLVNRVLKSQHLIFGDFLPYAIGLEDISRLTAIYLWRNVNSLNLMFGAGIEASFRVIKPNRYNDTVGDLGRIAFEAYEKAVQLGVPEQDARYMLPEGTLTRMIFSAPVRYLLKLANSLKLSPLDEHKKIGTEIETVLMKKFGFEMPEEKLPSDWQFWGSRTTGTGISTDCRADEIHSISLTMDTEGSLAMYAQLVRQRQLLCDIEPMESIVQKATFVIPPTFPDSVKDEYKRIAKLAVNEQRKRVKVNDPNFVYFLLLGQNAGATIYGKGAAVLETAKSRSEGVAQGEIRTRIGIPLVRKLSEHADLKKQIGPRCWRERRCIEPTTFKSKKAICPAFAKCSGNWHGDLSELMDVLEEEYSQFIV